MCVRFLKTQVYFHVQALTHIVHKRTHKHIENTYSIHRNANTHILWKRKEDKQAAWSSNPGLFMNVRQGGGQELHCHTVGYNWSWKKTGPHRALTCLCQSCQAQEAVQYYINRTYVGDMKISTTGTECYCKTVATSPSCGYYNNDSCFKEMLHMTSIYVISLMLGSVHGTFWLSSL